MPRHFADPQRTKWFPIGTVRYAIYITCKYPSGYWRDGTPRGYASYPWVLVGNTMAEAEKAYREKVVELQKRHKDAAEITRSEVYEVPAELPIIAPQYSYVKHNPYTDGHPIEF